MAVSFKTVLALDTAMNGCGVAVYKSGQVFSRSKGMSRGQAEELLPMIEEVLAEAGVSYKELDAIFTTNGPGAFTGLRIGLSTARSLALALSVPVYGITTLQILALQFAESSEAVDNFAVILETKREDFYLQLFDKNGKPLEEPRAPPAEEVAAYLGGRTKLYVGDAAQRFEGIAGCGQYKGGYEAVDPAFMARILVEGGCEYISQDPQPVYLRGADVSQPKKSGRVLAK